MTKDKWIVFDNQDGTLVKKFSSLESAERYIAKELRSLQRSFGNGGRVCSTLSICSPGESIARYSSIQGHKIGNGMPTYVSIQVCNCSKQHGSSALNE